MDLSKLTDLPGYDADRFVAVPFLDGDQSNARVIRLSPGQRLPAHGHGDSELMLFAVEGVGTLDTDEGTSALEAGSLACYRRGEELRVSNEGSSGLTLLAVLTPPFPPGQ